MLDMRSPLVFVACAVTCLAANTVTAADEEAIDVAKALGITPASLSAAGVSHIVADGVLTAIEGETALRAMLESANEAVSEAADDVSALAAASGGADEDHASELAAATSELAAAKTAAAAAQLALIDAATASLTMGERRNLDAFCAAAKRRVPTAFKVATATEPEWQAVEAAIRAEARATRLGADLDEDSAALLATFRLRPEVIAAEASIATLLAGMEAVFEPDDD